MKTVANIIWFIFGGFVSALGWLLAGIVLCITIVGIPFGLQCFKFIGVACAPFGKKVDTNFSAHPVANFLWLLFFGWELCLSYLFLAVIYCITIIGIPIGKQVFKMCKLSFAPFGAKVTG